MVFREKNIRSITKVLWRIENTGRKGIDRFELPPGITYPSEFEVIDASIEYKSPNFAVRGIELHPNRKEVLLSDIGVFNPSEFVVISLLIINTTSTLSSEEEIGQWKLIGKSLDLHLNNKYSRSGSNGQFAKPIIIIAITLISIISAIVALIYLAKLKQHSKPIHNNTDTQ